GSGGEEERGEKMQGVTHGAGQNCNGGARAGKNYRACFLTLSVATTGQQITRNRIKPTFSAIVPASMAPEEPVESRRTWPLRELALIVQQAGARWNRFRKSRSRLSAGPF